MRNSRCCFLQKGHDLVIGGHLRPDKKDATPGATAAAVQFLGRHQRLQRGGGSVWQHLRSFRKGLFDRIDDWDLRHIDPCAGTVCPKMFFYRLHAQMSLRVNAELQCIASMPSDQRTTSAALNATKLSARAG